MLFPARLRKGMTVAVALSAILLGYGLGRLWEKRARRDGKGVRDVKSGGASSGSPDAARENKPDGRGSDRDSDERSRAGDAQEQGSPVTAPLELGDGNKTALELAATPAGNPPSEPQTASDVFGPKIWKQKTFGGVAIASWSRQWSEAVAPKELAFAFSSSTAVQVAELLKFPQRYRESEPSSTPVPPIIRRQVAKYAEGKFGNIAEPVSCVPNSNLRPRSNANKFQEKRSGAPPLGPDSKSAVVGGASAEDPSGRLEASAGKSAKKEEEIKRSSLAYRSFDNMRDALSFSLTATPVTASPVLSPRTECGRASPAFDAEMEDLISRLQNLDLNNEQTEEEPAG
ncbi:MAG: hypothetical protein BJ554DRAFT_7897 [Olpidium bornovanus]|uniref:Uncharacterized protein n=1 Tax=Olpidium bornovanus TaxID=278681 RepID=A0A8H7ZW60_9FUNG|nr:MAG: hypothetical protein BJ554DRAFT_7897 [Olpidium bornovanus]